MKKKQIIILSIIVVILAACVTVGLCIGGAFDNDNDQPGNGLPVLPDTSEEVILGTAYEVAAELIAADGTVYTVEQATVYRKSDGKTVQQIYGMFDITDVLGYKIEYIASVGVKKVCQVHTLNVKDANKPIISIEDKHIAEVGVKYIFPQINVKDNSGAELTCDIQVYRSSETTEKIQQDADGFTPDQVGYYELRLKTADAGGNVAEAVYLVYARHTRLATEIDSFDDAGMYYTAFSKSNETKYAPQFSTFKRLTASKGSAMFQAGTGDSTGIYIAPRNESDIMEMVGSDGYISAWIYIATLRNSTKSVYIGNIELVMPTNSWQEVKITKDMIAQWPTYFNKISTYSVPLLNITNDGEDYTVFIDDIYAVKNNNISVNIAASEHPAGQEISVLASGGNSPICEYYYAGQTVQFTGSFQPQYEGEYLVSVYNQDRTALSSAVIRVGKLESNVRTTQWYVKGEDFFVPELNVYDDGERVEAKTTTWKLDLNTGEKIHLDNTGNYKDDMIVLYSESVLDGRTTALLQFIAFHDDSFGAWFDTDDEASIVDAWHWGNIELKWYEEFDGEKGVFAFTNKTAKEGYFNQRGFWKPPYAKEHYKRCTKLVFKLKADVEGARLNYIAEPTWTNLNVGDLLPTEWTEIVVDFDEIYNNFSGFVSTQMFWTIGSEPYTVYISDIYAVIEEELKPVSVYQGSEYDVTQHPAMEGCDIVECYVSKNGSIVTVNGTTFKANRSGMYDVKVVGYDHMGLYFENTFKVNSVSADTWYDFNDPESAEVWKSGNAKLTWLESYAGAEGVLKIHNTGGHAYIGNTNGVNWSAQREKSDYYGVNILMFRVKLESGQYNSLEVFGQNDAFVKPLFQNRITTDGWMEFAVAVNMSSEFDPLNGLFLHYWSGEGGTVYIDRIRTMRLSLGNEPEDMWYSFSSPTDASIWSSGVDMTWLESYDGAEGVLKMVNKGAHAYVGNTNGVNWPAVHSKNNYEGVTALKFRIKLESEEYNSLRVFGQNDAFVKSVFESKMTTDGWTEITVQFDPETEFDAMNGLFFYFWSGQGGTLYIDQITAVKQIIVEEPEDMWFSFSDAACTNIWTNAVANVKWLEGYDGADGVMEITNNGGRAYIGNTNGVNWPAAHTKEDYTDVEALKFRLKLVDDKDYNQLEVWSRGGESYQMVLQGVTATDGWVEYTIPFNPEKDFDLMNGMFFQYWSGDGGKLYIDEITVVRRTVVDPPVYADDMWFDFGTSFDANVWHSAKGLTWLESYEGAEGVLKIENSGTRAYIGNTNGINWAAVNDLEDYAGVTGLKFRVRVEDDSNANQLVIWGKGGVWSKTVFTPLKNTDGWAEFTVTFDPATEFEAMNGMYFEYWSGDGGTLYIDEITTVRYCTVSFSDGVESQSVELGGYITEPVATKQGYKFLGWYLDDVLFDFTQPITADITLTAKWEQYDSGLWYDFGYAASVNVWHSSKGLTWLESYEGAEGILKIENSGTRAYIGNTNGINWPAAFSKEAYEGVTGLKFRVRVEDNSDANQLVIWGKGGVWSKTVFTPLTSTDGWAEFTVAFDPATEFDAMNGLYFEYWSGNGGVLYIDEIVPVRYYTVSFSDGVASQTVENGHTATEPTVTKPGYIFLGWYNGDEKFDFTQPINGDITLTAVWSDMPADIWNDFNDSATAGIDGNGATVSWLESYENADGVLQIVHPSGHRWMKTNGHWPAAHSSDVYADVVGLKFRIRLKDDKNYNQLYIFCGNAKADGSDLYVKVFENLTTTDGWVEFTVELDVPLYYRALNAMQLHYWSGDGSTLYIDEITVVRTPMDVWNDFSNSATAGIDGNGATVSWLEGYENADGVLQIVHPSGHRWMKTNGFWPAASSVDAYADVIALKFRVRLEDDKNYNQLYIFCGGAKVDGSDLYVKVFENLTTTDGWAEFTVELDVPLYYRALNAMQLHYWSGDGSILYIDEITVIRQ